MFPYNFKKTPFARDRFNICSY